MNTKNILMKNLIDMGVVETDNRMKSTYISPLKDIYIDLERKSSIFSDNQFICSLTFKTNMQTPILTINTNELEIIKLIDSIYNMISLDLPSLYHYFNPSDTNCIPNMIGIYVDDNVFFSSIRNFSVYDYYNFESLTNRLTFTVTDDSLIEFTELLQYTFLLDLNLNSDDNKLEY